MKAIYFFFLSFIYLGCIGAEEEYEIEESPVDEVNLCLPDEECEKKPRRRACPRCPRYYYEERDIDAYWPGKKEDSFYEALTR